MIRNKAASFLLRHDIHVNMAQKVRLVIFHISLRHPVYYKLPNFYTTIVLQAKFDKYYEHKY